MGWAIGYDHNLDRDVGYGVPALCDHPNCLEIIDRGLDYVCAGAEPYGGEHGCGLHFCGRHLLYEPVPGADPEDDDAEHIEICERCAAGEQPFTPKPDLERWVRHKLTDESWAEWRRLNPEKVTAMRGRLQRTDHSGPPDLTRGT